MDGTLLYSGSDPQEGNAESYSRSLRAHVQPWKISQGKFSAVTKIMNILYYENLMLHVILYFVHVCVCVVQWYSVYTCMYGANGIVFVPYKNIVHMIACSYVCNTYIYESKYDVLLVKWRLNAVTVTIITCRCCKLAG